MIRTINLKADVPPNHQVQITAPDDVPIGPAEIVVIIASESSTHPCTLGDLLNSEFFGMWRDRDDIQDSAEFAKELRRKASAYDQSEHS
jgi:hypothetical protein